jgi:hypothetical protein
MEEEKSGQSGFKVVDRRRFASGEETLAKEHPAEEKPDASGNASEGRKAAEAAPRGSGGGEERGKEPRRPSAASAQNSQVDFSSFVVGLATQALVMLGEIPHPETGAKVYNADAARQTIDIIAMLEEKTAGNLSEDEAKLISDVLASVRMAFVGKVSERK